MDARCDAAREEERPPSRLFPKRLEGGWSKERGGATGRSPGLQKASYVQMKEEEEWGSDAAAVSLGSRVSGLGWLVGWLVGWSSRRCSCQSPFLPLLIRERALDPVSEHEESAGKPCPFVPEPRSWRRTATDERRAARASGPRRRGSELRSPRKDYMLREVATSFSFGVLCKCVCVAPVC